MSQAARIATFYSPLPQSGCENRVTNCGEIVAWLIHLFKTIEP
jgi:hypothetical protein